MVSAFGRGAEAADMMLNEDVYGGEVLDALDAAERRKELERATNKAAQIEIDLTDRGPLYYYLQERRNDAVAALMALATADPNDPAAVARLQASVVEYLNIGRWIKTVREEGEDADRAIEEEYGTPHDDQTDAG